MMTLLEQPKQSALLVLVQLYNLSLSGDLAEAA
jgi:hypothetical protein